MFSSSGFFSNVNCPYFANDLCERPYCHFRHATPTEIIPDQQPRQTNASGSGNVCQDGNGSQQLPDSKYSFQVHSIASTFAKLEQVKWYKPTPKTHLQNQKTSTIPKKVSSKPRSHKVPKVFEALDDYDYKPTPIHKLKQIQKPSASLSQDKIVANYLNNVDNDETVPAISPVFTPTDKDKVSVALSATTVADDETKLLSRFGTLTDQGNLATASSTSLADEEKVPTRSSVTSTDEVKVHAISTSTAVGIVFPQNEDCLMFAHNSTVPKGANPFSVIKYDTFCTAIGDDSFSNTIKSSVNDNITACESNSAKPQSDSFNKSIINTGVSSAGTDSSHITSSKIQETPKSPRHTKTSENGSGCVDHYSSRAVHIEGASALTHTVTNEKATSEVEQSSNYVVQDEELKPKLSEEVKTLQLCSETDTNNITESAVVNTVYTSDIRHTVTKCEIGIQADVSEDACGDIVPANKKRKRDKQDDSKDQSDHQPKKKKKHKHKSKKDKKRTKSNGKKLIKSIDLEMTKPKKDKKRKKHKRHRKSSTSASDHPETKSSENFDEPTPKQTSVNNAASDNKHLDSGDVCNTDQVITTDNKLNINIDIKSPENADSCIFSSNSDEVVLIDVPQWFNTESSTKEKNFPSMSESIGNEKIDQSVITKINTSVGEKQLSIVNSSYSKSSLSKSSHSKSSLSKSGHSKASPLKSSHSKSSPSKSSHSKPSHSKSSRSKSSSHTKDSGVNSSTVSEVQNEDLASLKSNELQTCHKSGTKTTHSHHSDKTKTNSSHPTKHQSSSKSLSMSKDWLSKKSIDKHEIKTEIKKGERNGYKKRSSKDSRGSRSEVKEVVKATLDSACQENSQQFIDIFGSSTQVLTKSLSDLRKFKTRAGSRSSERDALDIENALSDSYESDHCDVIVQVEPPSPINNNFADSGQNDNSDKDDHCQEEEADPTPACGYFDPAAPKKRVPHSNATSKQPPIRIRPALALSRPSPQQVMVQRLIELQKKLAAASSVSVEPAQLQSLKRGASDDSVEDSKPKIARTTEPVPGSSGDGDSGGTRVGSNKEGRIPHVPTKKVVLTRPTILPDGGPQKVPCNFRQRVLHNLVDETLKLYPDEKDAYKRAVNEEEAIYQRCSNKTIYHNLMTKLVRSIRAESAEVVKPTKSANLSPTKSLSHAAVLGGKPATQTTYTMNRSGPMTRELTSVQLYQLLKSYILTEEELELHGFPRPDPLLPDVAVISSKYHNRRSPMKGRFKQCVRCGSKFELEDDGSYIPKTQCCFHWGKCWRTRVAGGWDLKWSCCGGEATAKGCSTSQAHVHDDNKFEVMTGYRSTMPCPNKHDGDYGVYALDCEMVYTTGGCELARVTVMDHNKKMVLEKLVKPQHTVVDYNTKFSGLNEDSLRHVKTKLKDVQKILLALFNSRTILIGHSLESDLTALKIIHSTVVDTSVVFPHKNGLPFKRALRTLCEEYLQKIIQDGVSGHDSEEDALACMELMLWKIKDDLKKQKKPIRPNTKQ